MQSHYKRIHTHEKKFKSLEMIPLEKKEIKEETTLVIIKQNEEKKKKKFSLALMQILCYTQLYNNMRNKKGCTKQNLECIPNIYEKKKKLFREGTRCITSKREGKKRVITLFESLLGQMKRISMQCQLSSLKIYYITSTS